MVAEGRRQAYLAALGIPQWSARLALPGARPAPALVPVAWRKAELVADAVFTATPIDAEAVGAAEALPEPAAPVRAAVVVVEAARAPDVAPAGADRTPELPVLKNTRPLPVAEPPRPVVTAASSGYPRFAFQLVALAPDCLACLDLGNAPDLNAAEHQLLQSLTVALNPLHPFEPAGATVFAWPLLNNPAWPRDAVAAREAVAGFLLRRQAPEVRWLVLGEGLLPYLPASLTAARPVVAPALTRLLAEPAAKRALWQALAARLA